MRTKWWGPSTVVSALTLLVSACAPDAPPAPGVLVDGLFDEWSSAVTVVDDPPDAPDAAVDVLSIQALDEPPWLYLALDVGRELSLQSVPGTLHLLFDTDASTATGGTVEGMDGVDLIVDLSQRARTNFPRHGMGFALRAVESRASTRVLPRGSLGLVSAPTWSAPRFELRLSRLGTTGSEPFGSRFRMKVVYVEGDDTVEETSVGAYTFQTRAEPASPSRRPPPAKRDDALRVAQWNVASGSFTSASSDFARVLAALEPDVVLLDEIPGGTSTEDFTAFFATAPLAALGTWRFVSSETGGRQRSLVGAVGRPLRPADGLRGPRYPTGALEALAARPVVDFDPDMFRLFIEREAARDMSAVGAWIEAGGAEVLFVATDLQAAGWAGSPHDALRVLQAEVLRAHVGAELGATPAPVVIGGDLNLVGSRAPLFPLLRGLDTDGSDLTPVAAERLGERTMATWRDPDAFFTPGRLDFLLVADASLAVVNSFVFATDDLDDETLAGLGLERELMSTLSDHLVLVADLTFTVGEEASR